MKNQERARFYRAQQAKFFAEADAAKRLGDAAGERLARSQADFAQLYAQVHEGLQVTLRDMSDEDLIREYQAHGGDAESAEATLLADEIKERNLGL